LLQSSSQNQGAILSESEIQEKENRRECFGFDENWTENKFQEQKSLTRIGGKTIFIVLQLAR